MRADVVPLLRCPFCGTTLDLVENEALVRTAERVTSGVLGCQCCAFPIVAGIPVMLADDRTREAMHALEAGHSDRALLTLLGLDDGSRRQAFTALLGRTATVTYRDAQDILSPDAEGTYFIYRFSDPTYLMASAVLRAVAGVCRPARILDVCGGSGHLTRDLVAAAPEALVALADVFYWKLWLARTFTAPTCQPVCCDGNSPLPFSRDAFEMAVLTDAFPYIWHKRLLAEELMRVAGPGGVVVMPHLHSSLAFNHSAGMTLTPAAYADLFAPMEPRLFSDRDLTDGVLDRHAADLSGPLTAEEIGDEPSLTLVATRRADVFRRHDLSQSHAVSGELIVNPLYAIERRNGVSVLTLAFPTPEYEEEFGACRRYLPDTVTVAADLTAPIDPASFGAQYAELRRRRVLLDAPPRFC
ncbi:MAG TPA: methyltransferase domain-containing protein [Vicinamibacterales bacterium]